MAEKAYNLLTEVKTKMFHLQKQSIIQFHFLTIKKGTLYFSVSHLIFGSNFKVLKRLTLKHLGDS